MLSFKQFFKESPDSVYSSKAKRNINWFTPGNITFGTLWGIKDLSPFFIQAIPRRGKEMSHNDLLDNFLFVLQFEYDEFVEEHGPKIDLKAFEKHLKNKLVWNREMTIDPRVAGRIANEVVNSQYIMKHLSKGNYADNFDVTMNGPGNRRKDGTGKSSIEKQVSARLRTVIYKNAGRIWPKQNIISFWLTQDELTPQILDDTFNNLKIKNKQDYFIDVVNLDEIDKEESKQKTLPSYKDYKKRSSSGKLTKDQQKRAAEFMSKQHGVAGAQKAKIEPGNIPPVGAEKYAREMPLDVRQQAMTSESLLQEGAIWDWFKAKENRPVVKQLGKEFAMMGMFATSPPTMAIYVNDFLQKNFPNLGNDLIEKVAKFIANNPQVLELLRGSI